MLVHKIHARRHFLKNQSAIKVKNLDKFFETKSYIRNGKPVEIDAKVMRLFNEHMQEVQRDFRTKLALSEIEAKKIFFNA